MTGIVKRLRFNYGIGGPSEFREAADEIERLQRLLDAKVTPGYELLAEQLEKQDAEIERLRTVLKQIASCEKRANGDVVDIARAALEQKP